VIVEASAITEEGGIIPGASVGASPELIQMADKARTWPSNLYKTNSSKDNHRSKHLNAIFRGSSRHHND
jgi:hypothetical protein